VKVLMVNDIADCGESYYLPFRKYGQRQDIVHFDVLELGSDIGMAVFCGGSDVSPELYGSKSHPKTYSDKKRDEQELKIANWCKDNNIPMVGICRGAQFLCAFSGGSLVQHVSNHNQSHKIKTLEDKEFMVNSIHHQMQIPPDESEILAYSEGVSDCYEVYDGTVDLDKEPEAVCYYGNGVRALGFQWHPEIMSQHDEGVKFVHKMIYRCFDIACEENIYAEEHDEDGW
jgi:putative glutamine amidotransferase